MMIQKDEPLHDFYDHETNIEKDNNEEGETEISSVSYACEDCDYRWDVVVETYKDNNRYPGEENIEYCSMCGSVDTLQI